MSSLFLYEYNGVLTLKFTVTFLSCYNFNRYLYKGMNVFCHLQYISIEYSIRFITIIFIFALILCVKCKKCGTKLEKP